MELGAATPRCPESTPMQGQDRAQTPVVHVRDVTVPLARLSEAGLGVEAERTGKATDSEKA